MKDYTNMTIRVNAEEIALLIDDEFVDGLPHPEVGNLYSTIMRLLARNDGTLGDVEDAINEHHAECARMRREEEVA